MPGRVGKYEVLAQLTEGGMAHLYLGATAGPGGFRKYVVIKRMMADTAAADENVEKMFLDEARITAAFSYQGIAQVFDLGEDADGLYVVMEFIAGQNLNQVVAACARQQAVLPLAFSTSVVNEAALALHYAHTFKTPAGESQSVIHRDVAQKNIMVTYDGQVKLLDFGIAKVKNALAKTKVGTVKGTAGYMSPEQVRGEPLDARSDVFSLGVVLWEMATGLRLFSGETELEELRMILNARIGIPSEVEPSVPRALSDVIMKALARDKTQRHASAKEFSKALSAACGESMCDADGRAQFMKERFADKIRSTQALFEAASRTMEEIGVAVEGYRQTGEFGSPASYRGRLQVDAVKAPRESVPRGKAASKVKSVGASKKSAEAMPARSFDPDEEAAIDAALARDKEASQRRARRASFVPPLIAVLVLFGTGFFIYRVFLEPRESESVRPDATRGLVPVTPEGAAGPPVVTVDSSPRPEPIKETPKSPRGKGEVTLALLPEATVYLNGQQLAAGSLVTFSLPVGSHVVTVVGGDGVARELPLAVTLGKNKAQRFVVRELPVK